MAGEAFVPSMISISNRTFIERMKQWGWREKKTKGDKVLMEAPNGTKIEVLRPGIHQGNPKETFQAVLDAQNMTWTEFIMPLEPEVQAALDYYVSLDPDEQEAFRDNARLVEALNDQRVMEHQRDVSRRANIEKRKKREAEKKARQFPVETRKVEPMVPKTEPVQPEPEEPVVDEPEHLPPVKPVTQVREFTKGLTNRVLMHLVESDQPMSIDKLSQLERDARRSSIGAALANLVKYGVAQRVKPGVYRIRDEARRNGDVKVDLDITARAGAPRPEEVPAVPPVPVVTDATASVESPVVPADVVRTADADLRQTTYPVPRSGDLNTDELVNETLDLLFPQGFKARHLPLIDQWRQTTVALIREVNGT